MVSVVTPSYEQAEFLEDNLKSVRAQNGPSFEHVVIDGGSTDGSVEFLREYEDEYELHWISEQDDGQSDAINKGIEIAEGEWIIWVNSDDYLLEGALESFSNAIKNHPDCDILYGDQVIVDAEGNEIGRKYNSRPSKFVHKHYYQFTGNHSTFFRRDALKSIGGIDTSYEYAMDTELFWRILQTDLGIARVKKFFATRRLHEDAKTTGPPPEERVEEVNRLKDQYPTSRIERALPSASLTVSAAGLQALYHILDGRPRAIKHMLE